MNSYEELANTIIIKAVSDYRDARRALARNPDNTLAQRQVGLCERFFLSDWFKILSNVDGEVVLEKLRKEEQQKVRKGKRKYDKLAGH